MKFANRRKRYSLILLSLLLVFAISELALRYYFGFCDAVLYQSDPDFEYIVQPNQKRYRFRKHIYTNEYSMRSDSLRKNSLKILGLGDSVIYGGTFTDQDSLATTMLSKSFSLFYDTSIQILNISSASWGPDNCAAYLKKFGDFGAKIMFLVVSSHDANDIMTFAPKVGKNLLHPNKQYNIALLDLFDRIINKLPKPHHAGLETDVESKKFNQGFQQLLEISIKMNAPLIIYLHPTTNERKNKMYNLKGQKIIDFAKKNNITTIKELDSYFSEDEYKDYIHLNERGQKHMYDILFPVLKNELSKIIGKKDPI